MVNWSAPAKADLKAIHDFIATSSTYYAKKVVNDIVEKADRLGNMPLRDKVVTELSDERIREISLYSYRIIYESDDQDVFVLAVIHFRRDLRPDMIGC